MTFSRKDWDAQKYQTKKQTIQQLQESVTTLTGRVNTLEITVNTLQDNFNLVVADLKRYSPMLKLTDVQVADVMLYVQQKYGV
jgi:hypothetical protein